MTERLSHGQENWTSGEKRGEGAPQRMGEWAEDALDPTETDKEAPGESKEDQKNTMTRRDFIMGAVGAAAGIAAFGIGSDRAINFQERHYEENIDILRKNVISLKVPPGAGIDYFYHQSGWNKGDGSIDARVYRRIVMTINNMESAPLVEGQRIIIPIREGNTLETSN